MSIKTVRNLRRASQIVFFVLFFWLILKTNFDVDFSVSNGSDIHLPYRADTGSQVHPEGRRYW